MQMPGYSSLTALGVLMLAGWATAACAQTGPLKPRMVMAAMPTPIPKPTTDVSMRVPLNLEVAADGRVSKVTLLGSSGNAQFDEKVRKYYSRFRFIPALDDNGTPQPGVFEFAYKYSINEKDDPPLPPMRAPADPNSATVSTSGVSTPKVFDEVDRIKRMRCKDFLWEYDLMKDIAGAKPVYNEQMLRTSLAMFIVHKSVKSGELNTINMAFSESVRDTANQCRKQPDARYFLDALVPALESRRKR
jgi:TonB family protein